MCEPPIERGIAAVAQRHRRLPHAIGRARGTAEAHMEMLVVAVPGADLVQPRVVAVARAADAVTKCALDGGMHEDAVDARVARREPQQAHLPLAEPRAVDVALVRQHHRGQFDLLARRRRQRGLGIEVEPDVDIDAVLMRRVTRRHWPAPRLRHVADIEGLQPDGRSRLAEPLHEGDRVGMAEVAVPAQANRLIPDAIRRQARSPGDAAAGGTPDDPRGTGGRRQHATPGVGVARASEGKCRGKTDCRERQPEREPTARHRHHSLWRFSMKRPCSASRLARLPRGSREKGRPARSSVTLFSMAMPSSPVSITKSRTVHRWMFGVSYQLWFSRCVTGIRPVMRMWSRIRQWPKFGNDTMARRPMRTRCSMTRRGLRVACSVWLSTT